MHTDKWKGYHRVNSSVQITHKTVNCSESFINPHDGIHTQVVNFYGVSLRNTSSMKQGCHGVCENLEVVISMVS